VGGRLRRPSLRRQRHDRHREPPSPWTQRACTDATRYQLRPHPGQRHQPGPARQGWTPLPLAPCSTDSPLVRELHQHSYAELQQPQAPAVVELTGPLPGRGRWAAALRRHRRLLVPRWSTATPPCAGGFPCGCPVWVVPPPGAVHSLLAEGTPTGEGRDDPGPPEWSPATSPGIGPPRGGMAPPQGRASPRTLLVSSMPDLAVTGQ
jgi:hypothetical protein